LRNNGAANVPARNPQVMTMEIVNSNPSPPASDSDSPLRVTSIQSLSNVTVVGPVATGYVNIFSRNPLPSQQYESNRTVGIKKHEEKEKSSQVTINIYGTNSSTSNRKQIDNRRPTQSLKSHIRNGHLNINITNKNNKEHPKPKVESKPLPNL